MDKVKKYLLRIKLHQIIIVGISILIVMLLIQVLFNQTRWGLKANYYTNSQWKGTPSIAKIDKTPYLKGEDGKTMLSTNTFSVTWTGWIAIDKPGTYQFATESDDGSTLRIDGKVLVDNSDAHGLKRVSKDIYLEKGLYPIEILYFQIGGYSVIKTLWTPPGETEHQLAPEVLFAKRPLRLEIILRKNLRFLRIIIIKSVMIVLILWFILRVFTHTYGLLKNNQIKKYKKEFILSCISVVVFVLCSELLLRIINFTYFPVEIGFDITPEYKIFDVVGDRYKTKPNKAGIFIPQEFPVKKDANEIRVFLIGGSSVYHLGKATLLKDRLEKEFAYSNKTIRIINISAGGYGSTRLLLHFQEILGDDPDLIIFYEGHNEFEEKYVKDTLFKENVLSKLNDLLSKISKLYQFINMLVNQGTEFVLSRNINLIKAGRHPLFPVDFKVNWNITFNKDEVYQNYRRNLIEMITLAKNKNIAMVISTVAYNRMQPPFKAPDRAYQLCEALYKQEKYDQALTCFDDALDADLQPHRASTTSNRIVREIAQIYNIPLAEVDAKIIRESKNHVPGWDLFYDHCHLGDKGNEFLQEVLFETIRKHNLIMRTKMP